MSVIRTMVVCFVYFYTLLFVLMLFCCDFAAQHGLQWKMNGFCCCVAGCCTAVRDRRKVDGRLRVNEK